MTELWESFIERLEKRIKALEKELCSLKQEIKACRNPVKHPQFNPDRIALSKGIMEGIEKIYRERKK